MFKLYHKEDGTEELMRLFTKDNFLRLQAAELIGKHWKRGLRTLDSIQLASTLKVKSQIELFLTSDILLSEIGQTEGLATK